MLGAMEGESYFWRPLTPAEIHHVLLRVPVSEGAPSAFSCGWRDCFLGAAMPGAPRRAARPAGGRWAKFQCSGEEIHPEPTREREKAPCIAMISSSLPLDPLSSPPR
jgi:hypothetical protein